MKLFENLKKEFKEIMEWNKYGIKTKIVLATALIILSLLLLT
jgi:hypothetical protein